MQWFYLFIAGILETFWAVCLKYSQGFTRVWPSILTAAGMIASFAFLSLALKRLPLGTAYAVWTGIGMAGTFVLGIVLFRETATLPQILCLALILGGIIGLRVLSGQ
jgi:quaternary ammonium compound-resistance protein SugE